MPKGDSLAGITRGDARRTVTGVIAAVSGFAAYRNDYRYHPSRVDAWTFIWLMVALKIPIAGLLAIVWWAVHQEPESASGQDDDGGSKPRPGPRHPHRPRLPRTPRRGPHGGQHPAAPARMRSAGAHAGRSRSGLPAHR